MPEPTDFGYGNFRFAWGDHICAIFDDHAQQMTVMSSFIAAGLHAVQRCIWVSPRESADALRVALTEIGGDLATLEASGQLLIISEVEFYLQDGIFDPERTLDLLSALLQDNQREGYGTMRVASDVSWLREGREGRLDPEMWESFEARLTWEVARLPLVMVCQYARRQVSGSLLVAALRTHPAVILGDTFRQNPFYFDSQPGPAGPQEVV